MNSFVCFSSFPLSLNIQSLPATSMSAPFSLHFGPFSLSIPPSTYISKSRPRSFRILERAFILEYEAGIKL